jgi:hypothetical protein
MKNSILMTSRQLPGARNLILSPVRPENLDLNISHIRIPDLDYMMYSIFMIYSLHKYIETDYALIVQPDGWALDGECWSDLFFLYDYVGAPAHFARLDTTTGYHYMRNFRWLPYFLKAPESVYFVQNGGFSLRSRKLLETPSKLGLPFTLPAPTLIPERRSMFWRTESIYEDVHLCIDMRGMLEFAGCKFAPLSVAKFFSIENYADIWAQDELKKVFGHHWKMRQLTSVDPLVIKYRSPDIFSSVFGEGLLVQEIFERRGYKIDC